MSEYIAEAAVLVMPDTKAFRTELKAELLAATKGLSVTIPINAAAATAATKSINSVKTATIDAASASELSAGAALLEEKQRIRTAGSTTIQARVEKALASAQKLNTEQTVAQILATKGVSVNTLALHARSNLAAGLGHRRRYDYLRDIIHGVQQITGLLAGSMTHDEGYQFLRMARNLERADMTIRIIDVRSANLLPEASGELTPFRNIQWMSVLKSLSAYQMYRRAMQVRMRRPDVLKFLFKERLFQRAVYHAVCEVEGCLRTLPRSEAAIARALETKELVTGSRPEAMTQAQLHGFCRRWPP